MTSVPRVRTLSRLCHLVVFVLVALNSRSGGENKKPPPVSRRRLLTSWQSQSVWFCQSVEGTSRVGSHSGEYARLAQPWPDPMTVFVNRCDSGVPAGKSRCATTAATAVTAGSTNEASVAALLILVAAVVNTSCSLSNFSDKHNETPGGVRTTYYAGPFCERSYFTNICV